MADTQNVVTTRVHTLEMEAPRGELQISGPKDKKITGLKRYKTGGGSLVFTSQGERLTPGSWCSGCRNGGLLVVCDSCQIRSICTECILFTEESLKASFKCPVCFLQGDKDAIYPWTVAAVTSGRENWPTILTTPLAIISIHLEGMDDSHSRLLYHNLHPWFKGNVVLVNLDFNMTNVVHNDWGSRLERLVEVFETGEYKEWTRFFVLITTHSDPTTGFLHIGPESAASVPVNELMNAIFSTDFKALLRRSPTNVLSLLCCGAVSKREDSKKMIADMSNEGIFERILSFSQSNFQPALAHKFVMDWGHNHFLFNKREIKYFLNEHQSLGAHTDILQFRAGSVTTYRWTHPSRPFGININPQCSGCGRLQSLRPSVDDEVIVRTCLKCQKKEKYTFPAGWRWLDLPISKAGSRGAWIMNA